MGKSKVELIIELANLMESRRALEVFIHRSPNRLLESKELQQLEEEQHSAMMNLEDIIYKRIKLMGVKGLE